MTLDPNLLSPKTSWHGCHCARVKSLTLPLAHTRVHRLDRRGGGRGEGECERQAIRLGQILSACRLIADTTLLGARRVISYNVRESGPPRFRSCYLSPEVCGAAASSVLLSAMSGLWTSGTSNKLLDERVGAKATLSGNLGPRFVLSRATIERAKERAPHRHHHFEVNCGIRDKVPLLMTRGEERTTAERTRTTTTTMRAANRAS